MRAWARPACRGGSGARFHGPQPSGAGNRTSGPVLRSGSPRLVIQEAWAWLTATQLVRASEAAALHVLNVPGRQRHSRRAQKARPKFPHATGTKTTVTGKPQVTVFAPGFY